MAEFLGSYVHQQIPASGIFTVKTLNGILHGRSEFPVGPAELFQQHVAEARVWRSDLHGIHQFFYVVVHRKCASFFRMNLLAFNPWDAGIQSTATRLEI